MVAGVAGHLARIVSAGIAAPTCSPEGSEPALPTLTARALRFRFRSRQIWRSRSAWFSLRTRGELSPPIAAGNRHRSRGSHGMNPQGDQPSARAAATRRQARRRADRLYRTTRHMPFAARAERMLLRQRELRSRRHHFAGANVHEPNLSLGRCRQFWRRRNHVRLHRRLHYAVRRELDVGRGRYDLHLGRDQARRRGSRRIQRNRRHDGSSGDDVGHGHVAVELEIGRHDDGLGPVVGFWRNREDGLLGVDGICCFHLRNVGCAGVERRQIFVRRIRDQRRAVKRGAIQNLSLPNPRQRNRIQEGNCRRVQQHRLQEASPRQLLLDEDIPPQVEFAVGGQFRRWFLQTQYRLNSAAEFRARGIAFHQKFQQVFPRGFHLAPSCSQVGG